MTLFLSVIPKTEAIFTVVVIVIVMMMKPKMIMDFRVKLILKVKFFLIGFNKWCALW